MAAKILDGVALARRIREGVAGRARAFAGRTGRAPGLAVVLVGDDPASAVYVGNKEKAAREAGLHSVVERLPAACSQRDVLAAVGRLAADERIDGMLVQLPLPGQVDPLAVQRAVPPAKDVDGFHPENAGRLLLGLPGGLVPCTPRGILALLDEAGVELRGAEAVVVGRSSIVGKPVALLLLARHATVTICHSRTRGLAEVCRRADVLVAAVGSPGLVRGGHVRPGAVVIDVGTNRVTDPAQAADLLRGQPERLARFERTRQALVGDVHFGEAAELASWITPVPGGVGPLTVAMLLENTLTAAEARHGTGA
ncbi:MAG: bifunctional 5,10-methylenetetrahydrofolate dehydrogenase/5,10-methenyltetrahydrofolate cyclohydrolase [Acidobacteria bacterium]|nr:bifunctional 5,10-methylenetetrahydrofolate dehydrogenase/5,10-methenyltetrahydrofolate cyclohydrolase [Acidobacteriota bacterium]